VLHTEPQTVGGSVGAGGAYAGSATAAGAMW
jgi:hypothetical protein